MTDDGQQFQIALMVVSGRLLASMETEQFQETWQKEHDALLEKYGFKVPADNRVFKVWFDGQVTEMNADKFKEYREDLHRLIPWQSPVYEIFEKD